MAHAVDELWIRQAELPGGLIDGSGLTEKLERPVPLWRGQIDPAGVLCPLQTRRKHDGPGPLCKGDALRDARAQSAHVTRILYWIARAPLTSLHPAAFLPVMSKEFTRSGLRALKETALQSEVLIPLFTKMGFRDVHLYHGGSMEQGKDIVMWKAGDFGERINFAVVVKAERITGKASGKSSAAEVATQIQQAFGGQYLDPVTGAPQDVSKCFIVSSKEIQKEAVQSIKNTIGPETLGRHVTYVDGDRLWELVKTHLRELTFLEHVGNINEILENASQHHKVTIQTGDGSTAITVRPRHLGANEAEPIRFGLQLRFPRTEDGQRAFEAMQRHLETGAPVSLGKQYVDDFSLPAFLRNLLQPPGSDLQAVRLGPVTSTHKVWVRPELTAPDGTVAALGIVEFEAEQIGSKEFTLSNRNQNVPYKVRLVIDRTMERRVSFHIDGGPLDGVNCRQALDTVQLFRAFSKGGVLRFVQLDSGLSLLAGPCTPGLCAEPDPLLIEVLENLVFIQEKTRVRLDIPDSELTLDDAETISETARKIRSGRISVTVNDWTATMSAQDARAFMALLESGRPIGFRIEMEDTQIICGKDVPLGTCVITCPQTVMRPEEMSRLRQVLSEIAPGDEVAVTMTPFAGCAVELEYPRWIEADRVGTHGWASLRRTVQHGEPPSP